MKKSLFYYLFVVLCAVNLFSSCSENESIVLPIDSDWQVNIKENWMFLSHREE